MALARRILRPSPAPEPKRSARKKPPQQKICCTLCGAAITRFDTEIHLVTGYCAPCETALAGKA
jgi:hypothetical protein